MSHLEGKTWRYNSMQIEDRKHRSAARSLFLVLDHHDSRVSELCTLISAVGSCASTVVM